MQRIAATLGATAVVAAGSGPTRENTCSATRSRRVRRRTEGKRIAIGASFKPTRMNARAKLTRLPNLRRGGVRAYDPREAGINSSVLQKPRPKRQGAMPCDRH